MTSLNHRGLEGTWGKKEGGRQNLGYLGASEYVQVVSLSPRSLSLRPSNFLLFFSQIFSQL